MKYPKSSRRLRQALKESNMTQQDLSNASNVRKESISQYINGSHSPSNLSAGKMAAVLHVNPVWLMGYDVPMHESQKEKAGAKALSEEEQKIIRMYQKISDEARERILVALQVEYDQENQRDSAASGC